MERIQEVISDLSRFSTEAKEFFGGLSSEQLDWKPATNSWSIGQCFDHLITMNGLYFPLFQQLRTGNIKSSFWERYSPFSDLFGKSLIKSMHPENQRKTKTSAKAKPSVSETDSRIIDHFCECQAQLIDHLQKIPTVIDSRNTIITSPLLIFVTYSLDDCFTILIVHEQRHFGQARRVMEAEGFPALP